MSYHVTRTALLDGDIIAYTTAAWANARQVDGPDMLDRLKAQVEQWCNGAHATSYIVMLSCSRKDNFRRDFLPEYKAHRDGHEDPPGRESCVEWLRDNLTSMTRPRIEADDLMGILGSRETLPDGSVPVIVTTDKDLRQIPGWHYNPDKEDFPVRVTLEEADRFFYQQWMTGDSTDNIPGLFRVGPVKAQALLRESARDVWDQTVLETYRDHPRKYKLDTALAMARAVRILRHDEWDAKGKKPILWCPNPTQTKRVYPA